MADAVATLAALQPDTAKRTGPVFRLGGSSVRKAFDRALTRAGIDKGTDPASRVSFHTLRHTYASLMVMDAVPLMVVARNLGHADTRMVEKHYGHLASSYVREAIRAARPLGIGDAAKVVPIAPGTSEKSRYARPL